MLKPTVSEQLCLPFFCDEDTLRRYLEEKIGRPVQLFLTDNATSMLSARNAGTTVLVRMQRIFLNANRDVLEEIALFIAKKRKKTPLLREFIKKHAMHLQKKTSRKASLRPLGRHHDLLDIFSHVNSRYFQGKISCSITWGVKKAGYAVRRKTLGSYSRDTNTIRIHPSLDRERVPRYFIAFIVYHEMLHADLGIQEQNGRRSIHSREFRKREKLFGEYERALAWEKKGLA